MTLAAQIKSAVVSRFFSYGDQDLVRFLDKVGVRRGDSLMLHSSWRELNGYSGKPMDVRRSPSAMGLLTEVFRRGKGVVRSLSPTHPLLAWGADAANFVEGHAATDRPFGPDSPFSRLLDCNAMLLCLDCGFSSITFTHFVEDRLQTTLPFPLYEADPMPGVSIDRDGNRIESQVRVLSREANRLRREARLVAHLSQHGTLRQARLGNSRFTWIRASDLAAGA